MSHVLEAYKGLIADNPPMVIESEAENERALEIVGELVKKEKISAAERKLLRTWITLIKDYERRSYPRTFEKSEPREILRFLMEENGLTQKDLAEIPQSRISEIVTGKRGISNAQAKILGQRFHVNPSLFLDL